MSDSIFQQLRAGGARWRAPTEFTLCGETFTAVAPLCAVRRKRVAVRALWRGRAVRVQLMADADARRTLRRTVVGARAMRTAGIAAAELLHCLRADGGVAMVFGFIDGAQSPATVWRDAPSKRESLARAALHALTDLHAHGLTLAGAKLQSFMLVDERMLPCDLGAVRRVTMMPAQIRLRNIARFIARFTPQWQRQLIELQAPDIEARAPLERAVLRATRRHQSRRLKQCMRASGEVAVHKSWRRNAAWKRAAHSDALLAFVQHPNRWIAQHAAPHQTWLKDSAISSVLCVQMSGRTVVIKRHKSKDAMQAVRRSVRISRSWRNWRNAHLLAMNDIATPEPIAFVERRFGPLRLGGGYYVCAFDDAPTALMKYQTDLPSADELMHFAQLFSTLQLARLCHGDCNAKNLLVRDDCIALVDLDASKKQHSAKKARACALRDWRRFLRCWEDRPQVLKVFRDAIQSPPAP